MKTTRRHGKPAFTLIELIAVITIIVILAVLIVGSFGFVTERQKEEKAKVQIALLSKALEEYKLDMGKYPLTPDTADGNVLGKSATYRFLYPTLFYEGYEYSINSARSDPSNAKATKIYLPDLNPVTSKQGWVDFVTTVPANANILDPWGNTYCYRSGKNSAGTPNANSMNPDFDLWSMGKDGKTNVDPKNTVSLDDVRNF